ncbi:MAG TPA: DUF393 domain-containing protein, partial [Ignavibacteriaceae bacterium]|nr:DUF393 domain-containing protein [Ignavibacteriaceae bacterium]
LLSGYPDLLNIVVPLTVIFELAFILIMLFPGITWLFLLGGALFHVSIYLVHAPPFLHWPILYIIFIEPLRYTLQKWIKRGNNTKSKWDIIYDGLCPLCIRSMTIINYFDLTNKINFIDLENDQIKIKGIKKDLKYEDLKHSMHLISPKGKTYYGFYAFQKLSMLLPAMWVLVPILYFPFVDKAGSFIYDKIAKNRKTIKCNIETCKAV